METGQTVTVNLGPDDEEVEAEVLETWHENHGCELRARVLVLSGHRVDEEVVVDGSGCLV